MNYYSERDTYDIVNKVLSQSGLCVGCSSAAPCPPVVSAPVPDEGMEIPVEISARHVHLDRASLNILFGEGYELTRKRDLSQPGQYLSEERVKLVTERGQIANVGILGPLRPENQVELSFTDARTLGVKAPARLSGDLDGAADVLIVGPKGVVTAKHAAIVAKAHVHMTPDDARAYNVSDGEHVSIRLGSDRTITLNDVIVRVRKDYALAVHIDYDEANAANVTGGHIVGRLLKNR